jgi:mRNA-degrading endonuclease YafQ of YafQ-DinJ toxin-antitoxin module
MIELVWGTSFRRAYKKAIKFNPELEKKFWTLITIFEKDPFHPKLKTHKLSGKLKGQWAFVVEYDCRVIFEFIGRHKAALIDIGTHDEVY